MSGLDELAAVREKRSRRADDRSVTFDEKGRLLLPETPAYNDPTGLCSWLTCVFNLDRVHPITGGTRQGLHGPEGHVELSRAGAESIRFEPARHINQSARLIEWLSWQRLPTDGAIHALKAEHCREISRVIVMLCGLHAKLTARQEADGIVGDLLHIGEPVEGRTTYGTPSQRYEAAVALRRAVDEITGRKIGVPRYLIDAGKLDPDTGELIEHEEPVYVIAVSDAHEIARRHIGSSLARGWLDARMESLGWERLTLDGHGQPGRAGRQGPHARIYAYRGSLPAIQDDQEAVTT